jgi:hypothetical protein
MVLGSGIRDPRSEIRDPGSGKNLFWIPDPGFKKKAPDPGSGSATLVALIPAAANNPAVDIFPVGDFGDW